MLYQSKAGSESQLEITVVYQIVAGFCLSGKIREHNEQNWKTRGVACVNTD